MSVAVHIIEDDSAVRDAVRELVTSEGRTVLAYDSPAAFFAASPPRPGEIIILDIHFPNASGVEVAEWLRQDNPDAKIVLISGIRNGPFARALATIKPAASFRKPLDGAAFAACINRLASGSR